MQVPLPLREGLYDAVAARRYEWFGRSATCQVPDTALVRDWKVVDAMQQPARHACRPRPRHASPHACVCFRRAQLDRFLDAEDLVAGRCNSGGMKADAFREERESSWQRWGK